MKIYFAKRALALAASCSFVCLRERKNPGKTIPFTRPKFWQGENHSRKVVLFPVWNVVHYLGWTLTEIYVEKNLSMRFLFPKNMFYTKTRIHVQTKFLKKNPLFVPPKISASCAHTLAAVDNPPDPVRNLLPNLNTQQKTRLTTALHRSWRGGDTTTHRSSLGTKTASNALTGREQLSVCDNVFSRAFCPFQAGQIFEACPPLAGGDFWKEGSKKIVHVSI